MKKKVYATPRVEEMELQGEMMIAASMSSNNGIGYGGNASDNGINEADVNRNNGWNLW